MAYLLRLASQSGRLAEMASDLLVILEKRPVFCEIGHNMAYFYKLLHRSGTKANLLVGLSARYPLRSDWNEGTPRNFLSARYPLDSTLSMNNFYRISRKVSQFKQGIPYNARTPFRYTHQTNSMHINSNLSQRDNQQTRTRCRIYAHSPPRQLESRGQPALERRGRAKSDFCKKAASEA